MKRRFDFRQIVELGMLAVIVVTAIVVLAICTTPEKKTTHYYQDGIECTYAH